MKPIAAAKNLLAAGLCAAGIGGVVNCMEFRDPGESLTWDSRISSVFCLVVYIPRANQTKSVGKRGFAFELGGDADCARDTSITHWKNAKDTVPQMLLCVSARGGLEIPGGRRKKEESPYQAAERELFEETGLKLSVPLSRADAVLLVANPGEEPKWALFLRVVCDQMEFSGEGRWGGASEEVWGIAHVPISVEKCSSSSSNGVSVLGLPLALKKMDPWQANMILPLLLRGGILKEDQARRVAGLADGVRRGESSQTLLGALEHSLGSMGNGNRGGKNSWKLYFKSNK